MLSCYHPLAGPLLLALSLALLATLAFLGLKRWGQRGKHEGPSLTARTRIAAIGAFLMSTLLVLWLASYAWSPLPFAGQPVLQGFEVREVGQAPQLVLAGDGFSLAAGSIAAITPLTEPDDVTCDWMSREGAALDMPDLCDIAYIAPNAEYDRLRVRVRSSCGLPDSFGDLQVQILAP